MSEPTPQQTFRKLKRQYMDALQKDRINPDAKSEIERRMNAIDRELGRETNERVLTLVKVGVATLAGLALTKFFQENDLL